MHIKVGPLTGIAMWPLLSVYAVARVFQILPGKLPMMAVVALHVLPLLVFALIHGAISYCLHLLWLHGTSPMIRSGPTSTGYGYGSTADHILACR